MDAEIIDRVREIISELGFTNRQFAVAIGLDEDKLSKTLNGRRRLSPLELAKIAELSGQTADWILSGTESRRMGVAARADADFEKAHGHIDDIAHRFTQAHDVLLKLGRARELPQLPTLRTSGRFVGEGQAMAEWAWTKIEPGVIFHSTNEFIGHLEERFGVDVATVNDLPPGCDGLSFQDESLRLILLAATPNWTRKRFTLAHELGHLLWGDAEDKILTESVSPGAETEYVEKRANSFAGALLMPEETMLSFIDERSIDEHLFHELVMKFKVSPSAMTARLSQLGQITRGEAAQLRSFGTQQSAQALDRAAEAIEEGSAAQVRMSPKNMTIAFINAYFAGEVGTRPLESLTGLTAKELRSVLDVAIPVLVEHDEADEFDDETQLAFVP
jgi:Zn-dependent peptidase ImmA (M78 family)/transcriptional regulator with XRE-family HTH domain